MAAKKTLFVWIWSDGKIGNIPSAVKNEVNQVVKTKKLKGELGELALLQAGEKTILLCGSGMIHPDSVGNEKGEARRNIAESVARAVSSASSFKFDAVMVGGLSSDEISSAFRGVGISQYSFKVGKKRGKGIDVTIKAATAKENSFAKKMRTAVWLTQDLVNTPPDDKSPIKMTSWVMRELKKDTKNLKIKIWNEKKIKSERCGGILAVARGSSQQPRVMRMEYSPPGAKKHIVLVGKGVTFDSGGLNVKTYPGMKAMKCDMAGAAVVVGAIKAAASIGLKVKITGLIGMVENMSGADAYKPGDVVKMRSGKTVEVLNTDAEGRMVLADLLDIAKGIKADSVIDLATLTGACMAALGEETAGVFTRDDTLVKNLIASGAEVGELLWRLPLGQDFRKAMTGNVSDLKNTGSKYGGASSAAEFLNVFAARKNWAHIDIAGPSYRESSGAARPFGATGFGVATLIQFLTSQSSK